MLSGADDQIMPFYGKHGSFAAHAIARREEINIDAVPDDTNFRACKSEAFAGRGENDVREKLGEAELQIDAFVRIPECDTFAKDAPQEAAEDDVFGIHMGEYNIVFFSQEPRIAIKSNDIFQA